MLKIAMTFSPLVLFFCMNAVHADRFADKKAVESLCRKDATTAGCQNMEVGKSMGKCIIEYRKTHPGFKLSPACKSAVQKLRADKGGKHKIKPGLTKDAEPVAAPKIPAAAPKSPAATPPAKSGAAKSKSTKGK